MWTNENENFSQQCENTAYIFKIRMCLVFILYYDPKMIFVCYYLQEVLDAQIAAEREQYQPSAMEKFMSIVKSMMMRGLVIYFFMSMFRRQPPPSGQAGAGSVTNAYFVCTYVDAKHTDIWINSGIRQVGL